MFTSELLLVLVVVIEIIIVKVLLRSMLWHNIVNVSRNNA
ncbi:MAG: hypothetical protein Kow0083_12870 [Methylophaga sp.]